MTRSHLFGPALAGVLLACGGNTSSTDPGVGSGGASATSSSTAASSTVGVGVTASSATGSSVTASSTAGVGESASSASSTGDAGGSGSRASGAGGGGGGAGTGGAGGGTSTWVPSIMGVGYGGLRVISRDNGLSWKDDQEFASAGGDDMNLFRGIAYGNGTWVTTGWRFFTSTDGGLAWNEHSAPDGCNIMEGVAFGAGHFVGACGTDAYESADGVGWSKIASIGDTSGHTYVFFTGGLFYASGDSGKSYSSPDGHTWTLLAGVDSVAYCAGTIQTRALCPGFWNDGVYLGTEWESKITRSTDGTSWSTVYDNQDLNPGNNAPYNEYAFSLGESPP